MLLASIDFASDLDLRRRAVLALGELADERALDALLRLAGEDGHALQEPAAEAIGHLGRSPRPRRSSSSWNATPGGHRRRPACASQGLRWLDTRAGWQLIRQRAASTDVPPSATPPSSCSATTTTRPPATCCSACSRETMTRTSSRRPWSRARRLWGTDSLEPDYAVIQNEDAADLGRLRRDRWTASATGASRAGSSRSSRSAPTRCARRWRSASSTGPSSPSPRRGPPSRAPTRSPPGSPPASSAGPAPRRPTRGTVLEAALKKWRQVWEEKRPTFDVADSSDEDEMASSHPLTSCLRSLVWAAGRLGVAADLLTEMAVARPDDSEYRPIRREAVLALASAEMTPEVVAALEAAALGETPSSGPSAAQALGRRRTRSGRGAGRSTPVRPGELPSARPRRRDRPGRATLRPAARQVHYQGVVLPGLIERGDVEGLAVVAEDRSLPETTRLGAVEGLAAMAPRAGRGRPPPDRPERGGRRGAAQGRLAWPAPFRADAAEGRCGEGRGDVMSSGDENREEAPEPAGSETTEVRLAYAGVSSLVTSEDGAGSPWPATSAATPSAWRRRSRTRSGSARRWPPSTPSSASDYRYVPKDRTAYLAYIRMRRESANLGAWQAQQAYFSWLLRNDPIAFVDPRPGHHGPPRPGLLRGLQQGRGGLRQARHRPRGLRLAEAPTCGTTNIDFSQALHQGLQQMRSYRETRLSIGQEGVKLATAAAGEVLEKQIQVPDSWLRGFLQVQSAAALPRDRFRLAPIDLYNVLRHLRLHADRKGKRRGLRIELVPGEPPRLVLEPWDDGDRRHGRAVQGEGRRAWSASGAGAGSCCSGGSCRSSRRSTSTCSAAACRASGCSGPPGMTLTLGPDRLHRGQLVAGAELRPAPAAQDADDQRAARRRARLPRTSTGRPAPASSPRRPACRGRR